MVARVVKDVIDENSPLTTLTTTNDMASHKRWEIIVVLEGTVLETGSAYQCMKSYIPEDIKHGFTFDRTIDRSNGTIEMDFSKLDSCTPQEMNETGVSTNVATYFAIAESFF